MRSYQDEVMAIATEGAYISPGDWHTAPTEAWESARLNLSEGLPTRITWHHRYGWCVLVTAGQGTCLDYCENAELLPDA